MPDFLQYAMIHRRRPDDDVIDDDNDEDGSLTSWRTEHGFQELHRLLSDLAGTREENPHTRKRLNHRSKDFNNVFDEERTQQEISHSGKFLKHRSKDFDSNFNEEGTWGEVPHIKKLLNYQNKDFDSIFDEEETREEILHTRKFSNHQNKDFDSIFDEVGTWEEIPDTRKILKRQSKEFDTIFKKEISADNPGNPDFENLFNLQSENINCPLTEERVFNIKGHASTQRAIVKAMKKGSREFMKANIVDGDGTVAERSENKKSEDFTNGKENIAPQKNKFSRRRKSSKIDSSKKPFTVDIRGFELALNNKGVRGCELSQDTHEFWEAADEQKASKAIIMGKLRGGESCERIDVNFATSNSQTQRVSSRRKISQRRMRLKWFSDEIPFCTEDLLSLDDELLEEECETDSSFFTFISGLEKIHEKLTNNKDEFHASQFSSVVESDEVAVDVRVGKYAIPAEDELNANSKQLQDTETVQNIDIACEEIHVEKNVDDDVNRNKSIGAGDDDVMLSRYKFPAVDSNQDNVCADSRDTNAMTAKDEVKDSKQPDGLKIKQIIDGEIHVKNRTDNGANHNEDVAHAHDNNCILCVNDGHEKKIDEDDDDDDDVNDINMQVTPCYRNTALRRTFFPSPMPSSNPLASFSLSNKDACMESSGKRKLEADFDVTIGPPVDMSMVLDTCVEIHCSPMVTKTHLTKKSPVIKEPVVNLTEKINCIASDGSDSNPEQNKKLYQPQKKKLVIDQHDSLEGTSTKHKDKIKTPAVVEGGTIFAGSCSQGFDHGNWYQIFVISTMLS